jgi:LuxR family transcriptional regulator, maltose regulon positive regulatory protein
MAGIDTAVEAARRYIIKRPRLTRLLDRANSRVLMLIAPAGFGKTTLAREWAGERTHVWYQGTTATADVAALAAGLSEVVSELIPDAGSRMVHRMRATGTPEEDVDVLAELFAEDLADWPEDAWLVFDDYQFAMEAKAPERFMEVLLRDAPVRLLLTSRKRPSWASARRLLYGEVYELGRNELAMDHEEAANVLAHRKDSPAAGLVALAEGWPAVIGLAALTEDFELPEGSLPDALYEYFAEEIYQQAASSMVQRGLCLLTLAPSLSEGVVECLLGPAAPDVVSDGLRLGFLTAERDHVLEIHPLLRTFLDTRTSHSTLEAEVPRLLRFLISETRWDDCLSLLTQWFNEAHLMAFLEDFLPFALSEARLQTLQQCLDLASEHGADSPLLDLADAELLYRRGLWSRAEQVALYATDRLDESHKLAGRALRLAGSSAHMLNQGDRAVAHFSRARRVATSAKEAVDALFGQILRAVNDERADADELLQEMSQVVDTSPETQLKFIHAQIFAALSDIRDSPERAEVGGRLLSRIAEPLARTSFLNSWANVMLLSAQYERAVEIASRVVQEANDFRLSFVISHGYLDLAGAWWGLGNYSKASRFVERATSATLEEDTFSVVNTALLKTKILLALGAAEDAAKVAATQPSTAVRAIEAELAATRSLALACGGRVDEALASASAAEAMSRHVEVRALIPLVRAIVALQEGQNAHELACEALSQAGRLGNYDAVVTAFRAYPALLREWSAEELLEPLLAKVIDTAGARALAARAGATIQGRRASPEQLSPREQEVAGLVAQGFTNQQIAETLFISIATVKVHMNHIFEKIGVRTRTEAALRLAASQLPMRQPLR